jgi:hypothetical protein
MASAEALMAVIDASVESDAVRDLIAADRLLTSSEPDLEEGEPVLSHLSGPVAGYQLQCREGRVTAAFLFVEPAEGYEPFPGPLPGGLSASDKRPDVLRRFGSPERSGAAFTHRILGQQGAWDRFLLGPVCVHFQYADLEDRIGRVTLAAARSAPGRLASRYSGPHTAAAPSLRS